MKPSNEHSDSVFYGLAAEEIQSGKVDKGLMAKAIAKSKGDKKGAEVLYLEWRVDLLKEEAVLEFKRREAQKKAKLKEEQERRLREAQEKEPTFELRRIGLAEWVFLVVFVIVGLVFAAFIMIAP